MAAGVVLLAAAAIAVTLTLAGGTSGDTPAVAKPATPSPPVATSAAPSPAAEVTHENVVADPAALDACAAAVKVRGDALYDAAVVRPIGVRAKQSANSAVREQGEALATKVAAAAAGKGDDVAANLAMGTAVQQFSTWCIQHKFATA